MMMKKKKEKKKTRQAREEQYAETGREIVQPAKYRST